MGEKPLNLYVHRPLLGLQAPAWKRNRKSEQWVTWLERLSSGKLSLVPMPKKKGPLRMPPRGDIVEVIYGGNDSQTEEDRKILELIAKREYDENEQFLIDGN